MANGAFRKKKVYFSQVSNVALRDNKLSLKAKGLYALIQSYITIEDFTLYKNTLKKSCSEGNAAFEGAWNELKASGYLIQYKSKTAQGYFTYEYELIDDSPSPIQIKPIHTPKTEGVDNPLYGKVGVYNKTDLNNTNSNNTDYSLHQLKIDGIYVNAKDIAADSSFENYEKINEFVHTYLAILKKYNLRQKRVVKENVGNILYSVDSLIDSGVESDEWGECISDYIENLPEGNDGDIQCFLKASPRYFEINLDQAK